MSAKVPKHADRVSDQNVASNNSDNAAEGVRARQAELVVSNSTPKTEPTGPAPEGTVAAPDVGHLAKSMDQMAVAPKDETASIQLALDLADLKVAPPQVYTVKEDHFKTVKVLGKRSAWNLDEAIKPEKKTETKSTVTAKADTTLKMLLCKTPNTVSTLPADGATIDAEVGFLSKAPWRTYKGKPLRPARWETSAVAPGARPKEVRQVPGTPVEAPLDDDEEECDSANHRVQAWMTTHGSPSHHEEMACEDGNLERLYRSMAKWTPQQLREPEIVSVPFDLYNAMFDESLFIMASAEERVARDLALLKNKQTEFFLMKS